MTVISVHKDPVALTMTFTAEFDHPLDAAWELGQIRASSSAGGDRPRTRPR